MNALKGSLYVKFNVLNVGMIFVLGLFMSILFFVSMSQYMERQLDILGKEIASAMSQSIGNAILVDDRFSMTEQLIQERQKNEQIRYIVVEGPKGNVLASTFTEGLPQGFPKRDLSPQSGDTPWLIDSNEGLIREIAYPIDEGLVGYIRIGMTETVMMEIMEKRLVETMTFIFIICIVASTLATRFARSFLLPIRRLEQAARQIGKGDYSVRVPRTSSDDIGRLGRTFNIMVHRLSTKDEENSKLVKALQEKEQNRIWLINRLFTAREDERHRISRELHDESSQSMASILMYLRIIKGSVTDDKGRELISDVQELTRHTLEGIRRLAVNLHPPLLEDLGLIAAIQKYMDNFRKMQPSLVVQFQADPDVDAINSMGALFCYRIVQESLANIARHAQAREVHVTLDIEDDVLTLVISDDGIGFSDITAEKARLNNHLGLVSMRERTDLLQGTFSIDSKPGNGTTITITIPLEYVMGDDHEYSTS